MNKEALSFKQTYAILSSRFNATPEEIALWVWTNGHGETLAAYTDATLERRFYFDTYLDPDYVAHINHCWFSEEDVLAFEPQFRGITGEQLLERWADIPGVRTREYIISNLRQEHLLALHPVKGGCRQDSDGDEDEPGFETCLFDLFYVECVEREDLDREPPPSHATFDAQWRKQNSQKALDARYGGEHGVRAKHQRAITAYLNGPETIKARFAEKYCNEYHVTPTVLARWLKKQAHPLKKHST